jgi:hypothetical protein
MLWLADHDMIGLMVIACLKKENKAGPNWLKLDIN